MPPRSASIFPNSSQSFFSSFCSRWREANICRYPRMPFLKLALLNLECAVPIAQRRGGGVTLSRLDPDSARGVYALQFANQAVWSLQVDSLNAYARGLAGQGSPCTQVGKRAGHSALRFRVGIKKRREIEPGPQDPRPPTRGKSSNRNKQTEEKKNVSGSRRCFSDSAAPTSKKTVFFSTVQ